MSNPNLKRVLIGVGGGIAAYKICEVVSTLFKSGIEVRTILTNSAQHFITPLTFSTLSRHPAYTDENFWQPTNRPLHIELGEWADTILIAPLTANTLAKLAYGMADNLLLNTVLASTCPILLAPAMNTDMWEQETVRQNWQNILTFSRFHGMETASGLLACDRVGAGRMAEPQEIITYVQSLLETKGKQDFTGKRVLISAGGTREYLDPVRFIGNPATGKMGLSLAQAALHRGADVTLVCGAVSWDIPLGVRGVKVETSEEMRSQMLQYCSNADVIIMSAAVADVKPREYSLEKLAKKSLPEALPLERVGDIIAELANCKQQHQKLIGFAAQTGDIVTPAKEKLQRKNLDAIVANPIDQIGSGFGSDTNKAIYIDREGKEVEIPICSKLEMAHRILDLVN
ncbi:bifunctional phosphopantothenoylcysteine decarboxylase/phosphopantothenate--cysteine ligase CoaBC [Rivularia sp. UHCC 0363]|uniref:bifunctional phosphopantothenoylcysteine decarboxylase/phosphopantothenate--cysteine ligase CoaBC n=1 Tax=Rivularia sp. UHCC 0363 TaxID=3110244 RepID=UPI002B1FF45B|nr:bifunctional phosphopantothenoylcysteine decarboxylase/phosphopantothenate--cysteine ligase CoaBC [Rivularia sp. UHCC 0363]MEA5593378.1 bifunctional phosphopantothenoylcysteine decarboxylase/phosphopantothenate--cysteine ligase CoaBC [Rivularia sp. UHCC 0363]